MIPPRNLIFKYQWKSSSLNYYIPTKELTQYRRSEKAASHQRNQVSFSSSAINVAHVGRIPREVRGSLVLRPAKENRKVPRPVPRV